MSATNIVNDKWTDVRPEVWSEKYVALYKMLAQEPRVEPQPVELGADELAAQGEFLLDGPPGFYPAPTRPRVARPLHSDGSAGPGESGADLQTEDRLGRTQPPRTDPATLNHRYAGPCASVVECPRGTSGCIETTSRALGSARAPGSVSGQ